MFRVVLDANQFVSAILTPGGYPGKILNAWHEGIFDLVVSPSILDELSRVLANPKLRRIHKLTTQEIDLFVRSLGVLAYLTTDRLQLSVVEDPDDNKYLAAAVEGEASFVVSGDSDLLRIGEYEDIRILSPRQFWQALNSGDV